MVSEAKRDYWDAESTCLESGVVRSVQGCTIEFVDVDIESIIVVAVDALFLPLAGRNVACRALYDRIPRPP